MQIIVLGAGHVGRAIVEALHADHEITVIDVDSRRLGALSDRYDCRIVEGDGTTKHVVRKADVEGADLFLGCSPREEANLVCAMLVKRMSDAKAIIRSSSTAYLDAWRERHLEVDFMVSPELETAYAVSASLGIPAARHTDVFVDGQVQVVEFDVPPDAVQNAVIGRPLRDAEIPADSKVAGLIRGQRMVVPRGDEQITRGRPDRRDRLSRGGASVEQGRLRPRSEGRRRRDLRRRPDGGRDRRRPARPGHAGPRRRRQRERVAEIAETLPKVRAFHAEVFDPEFLERERIGRARAGVYCLNDDAKNLYGAVLAKEHGLDLTIALVHDHTSVAVYARGGVDVTVNPRQVTAEEMVRFAHDPRIRQIAMLEDDRFEILDLGVRPDSELVDKPFNQLPASGSVIGAVLRNGSVLYPHSSDILRAGDRVIVFVESSRASIVERAL